MMIRTDVNDAGFREATKTEKTALTILEGIKDAILNGGDHAFLYRGPIDCDAYKLIAYYLSK